MATYVVGDIQGCFDQFQCLLEKVSFNPDRDVIWSVGDLINRGSNNLATLRWFHERRDNAVVVLGNHDLHLMAVSAGARKMSKSDNFDDILDAPDRETLIAWLHHQPLMHHEHGVTLVHAGIPPCGRLTRRLIAQPKSRRSCEGLIAFDSSMPCMAMIPLSGTISSRV